MPELTCTVELELEEDGRWIADVVSLPGCIVYGDTREEALANARKLTEEVVAGMRSAGEWPPKDAEIAYITFRVARATGFQRFRQKYALKLNSNPVYDMVKFIICDERRMRVVYHAPTAGTGR